jgi:hypothetical protein
MVRPQHFMRFSGLSRETMTTPMEGQRENKADR